MQWRLCCSYFRYMSRDTTKPTKWVCAQRRLRSAWASTRSDQSLRCALNGWPSTQGFFMRTATTLIRLGAHSFCWFCHVLAHMELPHPLLQVASVWGWAGQFDYIPVAHPWTCFHVFTAYTSLLRQRSQSLIWAATWQNQQRVCARSEDSDQSGHPPSLIRVFAVRMKKHWALSYPLSAQRRLWSDWADAQADLSLRWAHTHFVGFVMSRLISFCLWNTADVMFCSKAMVPVLFLFFVALWFILRGASCFKVFSCCLSSCFFIPFSIVISSPEEEGTGLCNSRAFVCLFCAW